MNKKKIIANTVVIIDGVPINVSGKYYEGNISHNLHEESFDPEFEIYKYEFNNKADEEYLLAWHDKEWIEEKIMEEVIHTIEDWEYHYKKFNQK